MRFISNEKIAGESFRLYKIQRQRRKLQAKIRELKALEESLLKSIRSKVRESYQFADPAGWLMQTNFNPQRRMDIDNEAVQQHYAAINEEVPRKAVRWLEVEIDYV